MLQLGMIALFFRLYSKHVQLSLIRSWRAPEVCISEGQYNANIDVWAVGCIMAQLVCLQAIFRGNDNLDQLEQIFELTGVPDVATLTQMGCTESMKELLE